MSELVNAYVKYRKKREQIKERHKRELEDELFPYLQALGDVIVREQKEGKRIEDIEHAIGVRNRNLVYGAKRAAKGVVVPTREADVPESPEAPEQAVWTIDWESDQTAAHVTVLGNTYTVKQDADGEWQFPEEWSLDTENVGTYREVIRVVFAGKG